jgi:hypothetical protein
MIICGLRRGYLGLNLIAMMFLMFMVISAGNLGEAGIVKMNLPMTSLTPLKLSSDSFKLF